MTLKYFESICSACQLEADKTCVDTMRVVTLLIVWNEKVPLLRHSLIWMVKATTHWPIESLLLYRVIASNHWLWCILLSYWSILCDVFHHHPILYIVLCGGTGGWHDGDSQPQTVSLATVSAGPTYLTYYLVPPLATLSKRKKESLNEKLKSERKRLNCLSRYHSSVTESWVRFQTKIQSLASLQLRRYPSSFGCFTQSFSFEIPSFCKDQ